MLQMLWMLFKYIYVQMLNIVSDRFEQNSFDDFRKLSSKNCTSERPSRNFHFAALVSSDSEAKVFEC